MPRHDPLSWHARFARAETLWIVLAAIAFVVAAISWAESFRRASPPGAAAATLQAQLNQPALPSDEPTPEAQTPGPTSEPPAAPPAGSPGAQDLQVWKKAECASLRDELARNETATQTATPAQQNELLAQRTKVLDQLIRLQC